LWTTAISLTALVARSKEKSEYFSFWFRIPYNRLESFEKVISILGLLAHDLAIRSAIHGCPEVGLRSLRKLIPHVPGDLGCLYALADLLLITSQWDEAERAIRMFSEECARSDDPFRNQWAELVETLQCRLAEAQHGGSKGY
jgi:hypothetical protein